MVLKKIFGGGDKEEEEEIDIEEYLSDLSIRDGRFIESEDITYVKPLDLTSDGKGVGNVLQELEKKNIVVLNIKPLLNNKVLLRDIIKELRDAVVDLDGDIGKITDEKILLVPQGMRILHREAASAGG